MKKIILLLNIILVLSVNNFAQEKIDITKKPEPLQEKEFVFPEFSTATLPEGIKIFIVEDHEQPVITFQILIPGGKSVDGDKPGLATMTAELLTKGTDKLNALQIAQKLDGVGASISVNAGQDYLVISANCLTKHMPLVLDILSGILSNPVFPEEEFNKLVPKMIANIQSEKSQSTTVASRLAQKVIYGFEHPYAKSTTEASVNSIKNNDVKEYYKKYIKPNKATIAVVGDITEKDIVKKLGKTFSSWKKGTPIDITIPDTKPTELGVYFAQRPGSIQSTVVVCTKGLPAADEDYDVLEVGTQIIGAGFAGRLFRTLREKYSYTYSPYGRLSSNKYHNLFLCGADVRNSVTDSAISVIMQQLSSVSSELVQSEELSRIKNYLVGEYLMSFEKSGFVAGLIQMADFYNISFDRIKTYAKRTSSLNSYDIMKVTEKCMKPSGAYIVVVGSPDVKSKLESFGKVYEFDLDLNPLTGEKAKMESVSLTPAELIEKLVKAMGGSKALESAQTMVNEGKASLNIQGRDMNGTVLQKYKIPNKKYQVIDLGMFKQAMWVDGTSAVVDAMGTRQKLEGKELDKMLGDAVLFNETKLIQRGYKCQILGKQNNEILMKAVSPAGVESNYYFNSETYLINKIESTEQTDQGPMPITENFKEYTKYGDIMMPKFTETTNPMFTIKVENAYKFNVPVNDTEFAPSN